MANAWWWVECLADGMGLTPAQFWKVLPQLLIAIAALGGVIPFVYQRRRNRLLRKDELAWKKTELVAKFAESLDKDPEYQAAMKAISEQKHGQGDPHLERVLDPDVTDLTDGEIKLRLSFDRYLDFFDRLHTYIDVTNVLEPKELLFFSGYTDEVLEIPSLRTYAEKCGYGVVLRLARRLTDERMERNLTSRKVESENSTSVGESQVT